MRILNFKTQTLILSISLLCCAAASAVALYRKPDAGRATYTHALSDTVARIASEYPGEIGVAIIVDNTDTVTLNDRSVYPMMSVFKVHQTLAVCHSFDCTGTSLDTLIAIRREQLDPNTWSPMIKEHPEDTFSLPVRDLLRYTLVMSDNNASNIMFRTLTDIPATDSLIATVIPRSSFRIAFSEEEMSADHSRAYANYTSPLGAAALMNRLFSDSLVSCEKQCFITNTLKECITGRDRIAAGLPEGEGVAIAHKTGSGYINADGVLAAHNDVAYIILPGGIAYTLAVFVKDFRGTEKEASEAISRISAAVFAELSALNTRRP